jgi:RNA polymerase sigma-70 factor (ECF subfamily)
MDAPNLDLELARLITSGDRRRAATMLVERHASDVYALCRAMVRDATLAEDLSQDAFSRAIASLDSFRGESSVRTWILKIARNRCLDHLARLKRDPFTVDDDHDADDHPSTERAPLDLLTTREDAERALAAVSTTERALVVLHFGHGVGYPELSEAFGIKEGALRMRLSRALARMRDAVSEETFAAADELEGEFLEVPARPERAAAMAPKASAVSAQRKRAGIGGVLEQLGKLVRPRAPDTVKHPSVQTPPPSRPAPASPAHTPAPRAPGAPPPPPAYAAPPRPTGAPAAAPMPRHVDEHVAPAVVPTLHETAPASLLDRLAAIVRAL